MKPNPVASFKAPEAPKYEKAKKEAPKVMLESRSLKEIEEEKRAKKLEADCIEMYEDKCYTPPLMDKPPPGIMFLYNISDIFSQNKSGKFHLIKYQFFSKI